MHQNSHLSRFAIHFSDIFFLLILIFFSAYFISFLFSAQAINTGYPDWIVHAFRVKSLDEAGFSSWTHVWSNGISLWKSYQFLPHFITLGVSKVFHTDITRSMVLTTIGLYVLMRIFMYITLRALKFSPITAFAGAILSFDIAQYWGGVSDYSLMFGFTFYPLIILFWVYYYKGRFQFWFPYIVGISFYLHLLLGVVSFGMLILSIIFSRKKLFSLKHIVQIIIALAASSIFWVPIVLKDSYSYSSSVFANKYFLNLVISAYSYFGISLFLLGCFAIALGRAFMPSEKQQGWIKIFTIFILAYFILVFVGLSIDLPRVIAQFQFTRGVTFIGIGIIFLFAPVIERLRYIKAFSLKIVCLLVLGIPLLEGIWFASVYAPLPVYKQKIEPLSYYAQKNNNDFSDGRIWTNDIDLSSYYSPSNYKFNISYMAHLESNQLPQRMSQLIKYHPFIDTVPSSSLDRINDYYKVAGTKYIVFDESSPFTKSYLQKEEFKLLGTVELEDSIHRIFQTPWQVKESILIDEKYKNELDHFPFNLEFSDSNDQIELDSYVNKYATMLYKGDNMALPISYPTSESITVDIPSERQSNLIFINESYDTSWKAFFDGKPQEIRSTGPNFMLILLDNKENGGILTLKHTWPLSFYISLYLIILIPIEIVVISTLFHFYKVKRVNYI